MDFLEWLMDLSGGGRKTTLSDLSRLDPGLAKVADNRERQLTGQREPAAGQKKKETEPAKKKETKTAVTTTAAPAKEKEDNKKKWQPSPPKEKAKENQTEKKTTTTTVSSGVSQSALPQRWDKWQPNPSRYLASSNTEADMAKRAAGVTTRTGSAGTKEEGEDSTTKRDRRALVDTAIEMERQPVLDSQIEQAKKEALVSSQAKNRYDWLSALQEKQKEDIQRFEQPGALSTELFVDPSYMTGEEREAYVFSPRSGYSRWTMRQLEDDGLTAWDRIDLLDARGYTPMEAQAVIEASNLNELEKLQLLGARQDKNRYQNVQSTMRQTAQEHPVVSSLVSIPLNVLGETAATTQGIQDWSKGRGINPYSAGAMMPDMAGTIRRTVAEQIDSDALRTLYNAGMFAGDMALSWGLGELAFAGAGASVPLSRSGQELRMAEYANDIASMSRNYSDDAARAFLTGYDGSMNPQAYARAFDFYHNEGRLGMSFEQASSLADDLGLGISKPSGFQAHASGVNEAAAKSLTESVADDILKRKNSPLFQVVERKVTDPVTGAVQTRQYIDDLEVIDGKVGDLSVDDYINYRLNSLHQTESDTMILGRYEPTVRADGSVDYSVPGENSYNMVAQREGASYFDMGEDWDDLKATGKYDDDRLFEHFNAPALDEAEAAGKQFVFLQNPEKYSQKALGKEWQYLKEKHGYTRLKFIGGRWHAIK